MPDPYIIPPEMVTQEYEKYINKHNKWGKLSSKNLALCVGAGITQAFAGNWNELLNELAQMRVCDTFARQWGKDDMPLPNYIHDLNEYIKNHGFFSASTNVLEQGEYLLEDDMDFSFLRSYSVDKKDRRSRIWPETFFAAQVYHALEKRRNEKTGGKKIYDFFMEHINADDISTLREVLRFCLKRRNMQVINYNFDTILEELLGNNNVCNALRYSTSNLPNIEVYSYDDQPIVKLSKNRRSRDTIRIYHVHGIAYEDAQHPLQPLIFSENSYMDYQNALLNWSQLRIADILSKNNLLCVGFSGTDSNFRNLCRMMKTLHEQSLLGISQKHNVWLTQSYSEIKPFAAQSAGGNPYAFACFETITNNIKEYFDNQFGITVLWSKDYSEMADRLKMIKPRHRPA